MSIHLISYRSDAFIIIIIIITATPLVAFPGFAKWGRVGAVVTNFGVWSHVLAFVSGFIRTLRFGL